MLILRMSINSQKAAITIDLLNTLTLFPTNRFPYLILCALVLLLLRSSLQMSMFQNLNV